MRELAGRMALGRSPAGLAPLLLRAEGGEVLEDGEFHLAAIGDFRRLGPDLLAPLEPAGLAQVRERFGEAGPAATNEFGGQFSMAVFDRRRRALRLLQDRSSSPVNLYYVAGRDAFHFSTSLRGLLHQSGVAREWDADGLELFFHNGFAPHGATLARGVAKLAPGQYVEVDAETGHVETRPLPPPPRRIGFFEARRIYCDILENVVASELERPGPVDLTLSAGFDTNLLLHLVRKRAGRDCRAFTVGGVRGQDETPETKEIAALYGDVAWHASHVDESTFERLPDIVWRLEGAVYEEGIFLQYELARMASENGVEALLCGECADQVMHRRFPRVAPAHCRRLNYVKHPREVGLMLVMKKNGIVCNSFSIASVYPYLHSNVVEAASRLRLLNGCRKRFHKRVARSRIDPRVLERIDKRPGSTGLDALFVDRADFRALQRRLDALPGVQRLKERLHKRTRFSERYETNVYLKLAYLRLFETMILSPDDPDRLLERGVDVGLSEALR